MPILIGPSLPFFVCGVYHAFGDSKLIFCVMTFVLLVYSAISHKEPRFIPSISPLVVIYAAIGVHYVCEMAPQIEIYKIDIGSC